MKKLLEDERFIMGVTVLFFPIGGYLAVKSGLLSWGFAISLGICLAGIGVVAYQDDISLLTILLVLNGMYLFLIVGLVGAARVKTRNKAIKVASDLFVRGGVFILTIIALLVLPRTHEAMSFLVEYEKAPGAAAALYLALVFLWFLLTLICWVRAPSSLHAGRSS